MDAVKFIKTKARMTKKCGLDGGCYNCKFAECNNGKYLPCDDFLYNYPEEAVEIAEQWSKEHPVKTMLSEFLKNYPNSPKKADGTPEDICPHYLGYIKSDFDCEWGRNCEKCWNREIEQQ